MYYRPQLIYPNVIVFRHIEKTNLPKAVEGSDLTPSPMLVNGLKESYSIIALASQPVPRALS